MAAMTAILKIYFSFHLLNLKLTRNLVGSIRVTCRSKIAIIIPIRNPRWPPSWKSIFRFFYCTEMPVDSKVRRRHWGWLVLLLPFWKFQHFNLVSKIFQKLFKPLPCHKSIGKMLHAICISAVAVSLRWTSCGSWASWWQLSARDTSIFSFPGDDLIQYEWLLTKTWYVLCYCRDLVLDC